MDFVDSIVCVSANIILRCTLEEKSNAQYSFSITRWLSISTRDSSVERLYIFRFRMIT